MQNSCIITFKAYNTKYLKQLKMFVVVLNTLLGNTVTTSLSVLPQKSKKYTVIRSPHVYKSSREQFEVNTFKTVLKCNIIKDIKNFYKILFKLINNSSFFLQHMQASIFVYSIEKRQVTINI